MTSTLKNSAEPAPEMKGKYSEQTSVDILWYFRRWVVEKWRTKGCLLICVFGETYEDEKI